MFLSSLQLQYFRSYRNFKIELNKKLCVITGPNGSGKTNLLEAISLMAPGHGIRDVPYQVMINKESNTSTFSIMGCFESNEESIRISTSTKKNFKGNALFHQRYFRINECHSPTCAIEDILSIVWLMPEFDFLFIQEKKRRRVFFENMCTYFYKNHKRHIRLYERLSRERIKLLMRGNNAAHDRWLNTIEEKMSQYAIIICSERLDYQNIIHQILEIHTSDYFSDYFPRPIIVLKGFVEDSFIIKKAKATDMEEDYQKMLHQNRAKDTNRGHMTKCIMRTDFSLLFQKKNTEAALCSTGEQKILLLSFVLSHIHAMTLYKKNILFLLDEALSHLDRKRQQVLFDRLRVLDVQTIMASNNAQVLESTLNRTCCHIDLSESCNNKGTIRYDMEHLF